MHLFAKLRISKNLIKLYSVMEHMVLIKLVPIRSVFFFIESNLCPSGIILGSTGNFLVASNRITDQLRSITTVD